ncbi:MAG: helix-turn-helix transcriptional regulator [Candidatus Nanopelagicales bacterium]
MRKNPRFRAGVLRQARVDGGYSRPELAGLVGVSAATVKAWETGRRTPTPPAMARLAEVLGVDDLEVPGPVDAADLADLRERLGFSVGVAAEHLGMSGRALADVEAGLALPPDPARMARLYGVSPQVLAAVVRRTG